MLAKHTGVTGQPVVTSIDWLAISQYPLQNITEHLQHFDANGIIVHPCKLLIIVHDCYTLRKP